MARLRLGHVVGAKSVAGGSRTGPPLATGVNLCRAAGAAGGFLPHNFPRARMFMGDVSSVPLGFMLAVLAVWVARDANWGRKKQGSNLTF